MASKFAFNKREEDAATPAPTPIKTAQAPSPVPTKAAPAKALAKSKDPDWKGYTFIVKIDTHSDASAILKKQRRGEDMSDLAQRLLADWVEKNS
jgi:hypothetical protein